MSVGGPERKLNLDVGERIQYMKQNYIYWSENYK